MSDGFTTPGAEAQPVYTAAGQGRRLRIWRPPNAGPNTVTVAGLATVRQRARGAARNDPWAGTALDKLTSNGIGTGIECKPKWGDDTLRAAISAEWALWQSKADADWVLDWYGLQALAWRSLQEAGEVFARLRRRRPEDRLRVPLQVQLIEAEQCPCDYWSTAPNGNPIRAGIEFDRIGRRLAYWMYRAHPGDVATAALGTNGTELVRVPAEDVLHLYMPERPGQLRGIPRLASVLVRLFNLDRLDDSVLERQAIANLFAGFLVPASSDEPEPPAGVLDEAAEGHTDRDGTPLPGLEPGTMAELPAGMEPKFTDPPGAPDNYAQFLRGHLLAVAARAGVPYEVLTGDLAGVSDRALRLLLNEFRRHIEMWQWLCFIPQFCQPVRGAWFDSAVMAGVLDIPGFGDVREQAVQTLWVPMGWPYSHPVQDVDADTKAIRSGLTSRTSVVLANGEDAEQIDAEQAADNERADSMGLRYDSDGRQAKGASTKPPANEPPKGETDEP